MRHRSSRPLLDRLLRRPSQGMLLRSGVAAGGVLLVAGLGIVIASPAVEEPTGGIPFAQSSPEATPAASWSIGTPDMSRGPRPSRGQPRLPQTPEPTPTDRPTPPPTSQAASPPTSQAASPSPRPSEGSGGSSGSTPAPSPETSAPEDDDAPETTASTASLDDGMWTVRSSADEPATFQCALDGGGYDGCASTTTFDDLDNGRHSLLVRAVDRAGNVDPTPAKLSVNLTGDLS